LAKEAPTPIVIPAMPTPEDLSKWITETIKKQVLKTLSTEHAETYQEALDKLNELQAQIEETDLVKGFSDKANANFQKVFPELSLSISPLIGQSVDVTKALDKEFCVAINHEGQDGKSEFNSHGHGVIRQAMFNFLGLSKNDYDPEDANEGVKKEFIILFEEPELYLHPKRIRLLKDTLYSLCRASKFQILCASHNPQLIDLSKPHTTLVEGDTEAIVVRQLLHEHYPEKDIFVLNTGTKNNMPFFVKVLSHFKIKQHVIHDSDCRYQYDRDVSVQNFEDSHNYSHDAKKGKPLSAWEFAQNLDIAGDASITSFVRQIAGIDPRTTEFTQENLEEVVVERYQLEA